VTNIFPEEVPQFRGPRPPTAVAVKRLSTSERFRMSRRKFIGGAVAVGTVAGLAIVGFFPPARRAKAGGGYDIRETCGEISSGPGTCNVPCGPSDIHLQSCEDFGPLRGFHMNTGVWDLRPGQCYPGTNAWDGWKWKVPNCEDCHPRQFRCHDGWHDHAGDPGAHDHKSVCLWRLSCG
jgi:hypothetical protein